MIADDLLRNNPLLIVDIGASGGIDPRWDKFTSCFKGILFEPDPREFDILRSQSKSNLTVLNSALSDSVSTIDFHLCKKQQVSSVYLPNFDFLKHFPDSERFQVVKSIKMETDTLNKQLQSNDISEIDFIKLDTQGYELPILKGSTDYLDKVIGLEIEVEFAPMYIGQPLFCEVDSFVTGHGFELFDIKRHYCKRNESTNTGNQKGQLWFGDALYFKSPEQILLMDNLTDDKIVRSVCTYLVYGYLDLAQSLYKSALSKELLGNNTQEAVAKVLSKYMKPNQLPYFRGKARIQNIIERLGIFFSSGTWWSGNDKTLGNS